jgi:tRNA(Ile)-lysidine synthase
MRPGPSKPILSLRRAETVALCAQRGLDPVVDPSNHDPSFRRNRVRHEVLPLLCGVAERDVVPLLHRAAELARVDLELLDELAAAIDPSDGAALAGAPLALARRAVRRWLVDAAPPHPPDLATVDRVLEVARGHAVATEVAGGLRVARTGGRLRLERTGSPPAGGR